MSKDTRIAFRTSTDLKGRLAAAAKITRLSETQLAEACVEALVEYVEKYGEITTPFVLIPKSKISVADLTQTFPSTAEPTPRASLHEAAPDSTVLKPDRKPSRKEKPRAVTRKTASRD